MSASPNVVLVHALADGPSSSRVLVKGESPDGPA